MLKDLNLDIAPGQTVALVGQTGAGKTTIVNLIPRFYDVTEGAVKLDGHDVRTVTRDSVRRQIATVLQESFLFSGTVAENIGYGREGATRAEIEAAAQTVDAHTFIMQLPQGYDTAARSGRRHAQSGATATALVCPRRTRRSRAFSSLMRRLKH